MICVSDSNSVKCQIIIAVHKIITDKQGAYDDNANNVDHTDDDYPNLNSFMNVYEQSLWCVKRSRFYGFGSTMCSNRRKINEKTYGNVCRCDNRVVQHQIVFLWAHPRHLTKTSQI